MRNCYWLLAALCLWPAHVAQAATIAFDFDTSLPVLANGQGLPLDQTKGGVTAQFRFTAGFDGFSVQSDGSTGFTLSQFSGHYLDSNGLNPGPLYIGFSQLLTSFSFTFATADFHQVEATTTILLTAYLDSTGTAPVGSATAHGTYGADTMPMGALAFTSGLSFNLVEIKILPGQPLGATAFLVDNIQVTAVPAATTGVPEPTGYALVGIGLLALALRFRRVRAAA